MAAAPSQPISIGRMPSSSSDSQNHLNVNYPRYNVNSSSSNTNTSAGGSGTSPAISYLGAALAAQNPRWAGSSASPARSTQELSTSWNIHPGPLFVSSPHNHSHFASASSSNGNGMNTHAGTSGSASSNTFAGVNPGSVGAAGSFSGGTPMSLSSSFQARFLPNSSSSTVLNPLDPTDFKFSSSPYGKVWNGSYPSRGGFSGSYGRGGGGFVGSVESDRMSLIESYYGGKGEKEACRDFTCCGLRLSDFHALLEHFESIHANAYDISQAYAGLPVEQLRGRKASVNGSRRLVNQSSSSSLAGALGDDAPHARTSASNNAASMRSNNPSAANSTSSSPVRSSKRMNDDMHTEDGTKLDDMEIGLDLDMDMDVDGDQDDNNNIIHSTSHSHSHPGSGSGSPNVFNGSSVGLGHVNNVGGSRATSPPDTPLLSTPISPSVNSANHSNAGSGFNTPGTMGDSGSAFQGFALPSSMIQNSNGIGGTGGSGGSGGGGGTWGENAVTPMPMTNMKNGSNGGGAYFGQQHQQHRLDEDNLSAAGTSDGSGSPAPPSSAASMAGWDGTDASRTVTHTQSLYDLRATAHARAGFTGGGGGAGSVSGHAEPNVSSTATATSTGMTDVPPSFAATQSNQFGNGLEESFNNMSGISVGVASGLAGGAAAQRMREREEALLRSGSGVLNGYAGYADWSRGFPGVADSTDNQGNAPTGMAGVQNDSRMVGPTESGVHPGLLFGNSGATHSNGEAVGKSREKEGTKEKNKITLKLGTALDKSKQSAGPSAGPLTPSLPKPNVDPAAAVDESITNSILENITNAGQIKAEAGGANTNTSSLLLNKPFKCPTPGCTKSYKQANGLKYHVTHGQCSFTPPPELSSLTALSALASSSLSPTSPTINVNGKDVGGSSISANTLDKLKASLSLTQSASHNAPLTLLSAEETLARLSAEERREVEREAERRLRPFCCAVPPCQRRYKNMNGLRYHYAHSGEHGKIGMRLLSQGKGGPIGGSGSTTPKEGMPPHVKIMSDADKKKMAASAPTTPRSGAFPQFQQQPHQRNQTQLPQQFPPFPFPFPFPNGINMANMYASFQLPTPTQLAQVQAQVQAQARAVNAVNINTNLSSSNMNGSGTGGVEMGNGPKKGIVNTQGMGPGVVLSQPASAYASPWGSRAASPTRSSGSNGSGSGHHALTSPIEEPPQSAYPNDMDEEAEQEAAEAEGEFGYPEEIEEEMLEMEGVVASSS